MAPNLRPSPKTAKDTPPIKSLLRLAFCRFRAAQTAFGDKMGTLWVYKWVTTQVVFCWLRRLFSTPWKGNLHVAQGRAKRRPGYCRPSPAFALQGQKHKSPRLLFVHTLHLLYMLLPLQGESAVVYSSPRAPLRSALGYALVAPSGRAYCNIPSIIGTQPNWFFPGYKPPE